MEAIDRVRVVADVAMDSNDANQTDDDPEFGPLEAWMATIILFSCLFVLMATIGLFRWKNILTYWDQEGSTVVREYLQKMTVCNMVILGILYVIYKYVFDYNKTDSSTTECLKLGEHKFIVFLILAGSLVAGLIRFLAVGFANSENYDFVGQTIENQNANMQHGFSVNTSLIYKNMITPYLRMACVVLLLATVFMFAPISNHFTDPVLDIDFCVTSWPFTGQGYDKWRLLPVALLLLLPIFTIILVEHVSHVRKHGYFTKIPGYISILNAPFIMVALTTTWSMWFGILFVVWWTFGIGAGEYFSMFTLLFVCFDSVALLFIAIIVGRKKS